MHRAAGGELERLGDDGPHQLHSSSDLRFQSASVFCVSILFGASTCTGLPSANLSALGMTVHPSRVPVKPAYLLKLHVSSAHVSAPEDKVCKLRAGGTDCGACNLSRVSANRHNRKLHVSSAHASAPATAGRAA